MAKPKETNNQRLIVILVALLILLALAAAYLFYSRMSAPQEVVEVEEVTAVVPAKPDKKEPVDKTRPDEKDPKELVDKTKPDEKDPKEPVDKTKPDEKDPEKTDVETSEEDETGTQETEKDVSIDIEEEPEEIQPSDPLEQMPPRKSVAINPFSVENKPLVKIKEARFSRLKAEAEKEAGKFNPFVMADLSSLFPPVDQLNVESIETHLPDIPSIPHNITLPPDLESFTGLTTQSDASYRKPSVVTNTILPEDVLSSAQLTGIIGDAAVIKFNGVSRALHAGQNYRGIVVLSVTPNSATLELNGVKVTKTIKGLR